MHLRASLSNQWEQGTPLNTVGMDLARLVRNTEKNTGYGLRKEHFLPLFVLKQQIFP